MPQNHSDWPVDDGTFDSKLTVFTLGVLAPLMLLAAAAIVAWNGGITLSHEGAVVHYHGFHAIASIADLCLGVALILVAKFLLPNVFPRSYNYQHFAAAGIVMVVVGLMWFLIAALLR